MVGTHGVNISITSIDACSPTYISYYDVAVPRRCYLKVCCRRCGKTRNRGNTSTVLQATNNTETVCLVDPKFATLLLTLIENHQDKRKLHTKFAKDTRFPLSSKTICHLTLRATQEAHYPSDISAVS
jgi:hypothetical protein